MTNSQARGLAHGFFLSLIAAVISTHSVRADQIAAADLQIQGVGLKVITVSATTGLDVPAQIQTEFGGKQNDDATVVEGLLAVGDLTGPGIDAPIRLETAPGHKFQIPGLSREGVYFLQNIRLMKGADFLQSATPSIATITVSNLLQTSVRVKQLTPDEIRARGISVDARNFDVFEYTFSFLVNGQTVEIPFPVIIDPRTHEVHEVPKEEPYRLPPVTQITPPRWDPPQVLTFEMEGGGEEPPTSDDPAPKSGGGRPSIPAALIIPNSLAVLHQFFAVTLMVTNGAPTGSEVTLDSVTAVMKPPAPLRTVKSNPSVAFNQPVPIVDATTGVTFLVAQAKGEVEWTMEGLQPGTHTVEVEVRATFKAPGQADFPLKGSARASVVIHDPRFNINFSHPDTVRKGIDYSTFSFITNMSGSAQNIRVVNGLQACADSPGANVCRVDGTPAFHDLSIPAGEMRSVEYKLRPGITGHVFATAGSVSDEALTASVQLTMGVSESGIPLSPATLILPYYARYIAEPLVSANLQLLGLGYSLATAPLTQALASHPHVIKSDVFQRAVDIARAGQRVFLGESMRDSLAHMTLDLLGNAVQLSEWDDLRRQETSGRTGAASIAREIENSIGTATFDDFVSRFATITAWRAPYLLALAHGGGTGARPYALSLRSVDSGARLDVPSEATDGWVRTLPFAELNTLQSADKSHGGELAVVGRWAGDYEVTVTPAADGPFALDLILPAAADGSVLRAHFDVSGNAGKALTVVVTRGATSLSLHDSVGGIAAVGTITPVSPEPIHIIGARQDLNLDAGGHKVSVLFNRPVSLAAGDDLLTKFSAQIALDRDGVSYRGSRPMSAAALQEGSRIANVTFDHALSQNATYSMNVAPLVDPLSGASVTFPDAVVPVIDNDSPGGIIFGHVLKGDNTPVPGADVQLYLDGNAGPPQYDTARDPDGSFLFEFVPRDIDNGIPGTYILRGAFGDKLTVINGAVRLPGRVHFVNLVFLGRGSAEGYVKYDNGDPVPGASVVVGSTLFDQFRTTTADANGHYTVGDLPVGPLTFSATDKDGNVTFAAGEIKTAGQLLQQNLSIFRRPFPGTGTIRGIVRRSDTNAAVVGAHVGVYSQGYGLIDGFTDAFGSFEFRKVPSGFVTVLASEWSISRESVALDFDLAADESRDVLLTLNVHPTEALVGIEGDVVREDPLHPGDSNFYQKVAGALVKIEKAQAVTADANGHFILTSIPVSFSGKNISAYDPITTRSATTVLPQLDPSKTNLVPIFISTASGYGEGTIRVRLLDAAGFPVTGYRVIVPGFPPFGPTVLDSAGSGVYQLQHVAVGSTTTIWAIGSGAAPYGDQTATGSAKVEFNGHVAALNLRLSGQGTVRVKLTADIDVIGDVKMTYPVWDEAEQGMSPKDFTASTSENGVAGYATFKSVPALQTFTASSQHPVYGYAAQSTRLGFDGDVQSITLQLNKLSIVRGTVYAIDGRTPVAGAAVRIEDGRQNPGIFTSLPDGTFEFRNVAAGVGIRVIAEVTQDGTYRTGMVSASTPSLGGPVNGLSLILRTQGGIDARIVYAGYKVFDPQNPANNVIDNTPNDLSDNAPVPLAKFVLRELDFPYRSFGTTADPLSADAAGRFSINNVFTGPLRVSASDPGNQETRGSWTGSISQEGERVTAIIGIGAEGFGPVNVSVVDPNAQNAPVINAEVSLLRSGFPFDLSTTDATGTVVFDQVPVGTYTVGAYSKSLGKSGSSGNFTVAAVTGAQVQVVLQFSGVVNGTLTDPEAGGRGVPGAPVTLTEQSFQTRASSDVAGNYIFNGVREGIFRLDTKDTLSNRRATASHELTQADPNPTVNLQLEPTDTLNLSVYLPDDSGGNSNVLAPIVNLDVTQRNGDFIRSLQGNHFQMPGLFRNEPYSVAIKEIGGNGREIHTSASFPLGSAANPLNLVLPAYGSVETHVIQGTTPAANAKVTVSGSSKSVTVYTDATGVAVAQGVPLGAVYVQVVSVDGAFSGSASATLTSQSTPTIVAITLGAYAGVSGLVDAETGGPSIGTRVIASFGRILEAITDSTGRFTFQGIPTGTRVDLTYMGPNDVTVGARQSVNVTIADASRVIEVPRVRLDATPPQVISIQPADGSANVSPDAALRIIFSEPIAADQINTNFLQLLPADSPTPVATTFGSITNADGTFTVSMTPPPAPPGQRFPLQSNTLYRIIISGEIHDLTGNKLPAARGASFITSDYAEPRVVKTIPATTAALLAATTFEFRFNEPIDPAPWQPGGGGVFHLYKISAPGPSGAILADKPGRAFTDPATGLSLFFAPDDPIEPSSFYRVVFSGVRDLQGNVTAEQTFHFFSFDNIKPFVILVSPVPPNFALVSGVEYVLGADIRNTDANGATATDVAKVDYFRVDGTTVTYLTTVTSQPWSYRFVAPETPAGGSTLTLQAVATDLSFNPSDPATITWQVNPNQPPQNVAVTLTPPSAIYPGNHALASVTFDDEGTFATVQIDAAATENDGSAYAKSQVKQLTRARVNDPWPQAQFDFDLPPALKQGTNVTFTATVTDVRGLKGTASASLALSTDTIAPTVLSLSPAPQTTYRIGDKYQIVAIIKDLETGASDVTFSFDNQTIKVSAPSPQVTLIGDHTWAFTTGPITVPAKNVDTTIPITITAKDYSGNPVTQSTEVIYTGVNDPSVPKGAWLCPIDRAAYPANQSVSVKLQVRATDDIAVTGVKFTVPGVTDPIAATRVGTSDVYEATATLAMGDAGTSMNVTATVSDADPTHDITLTLPIDAVAVDITVDNRTQAITPTDVATYQGKSILVRGTTGLLIPHTAIAFKNLIVLDGGRVDTLPTTTTTEYKLDLTISDHLYVDCASSLNVTGRGYAGGWEVNGDGSGTKNDDARGRTAGNTATGGPTPGASASYGGLGGERSGGVTNNIYGSLTDPTDLGAGGAGSPACCSAGAQGGGAIRLRGGTLPDDLATFAIAGAVRADGATGVGLSEAGSGGSVLIDTKQVIISPSARITANGGDDDADSGNPRGAGGGRVAVKANGRLDVETLGLQIQSRGGRNNTSAESANYLDGGAGTIFLRRPGQTLGELFAGSFDERAPLSVHNTRPTPLAGASLAFEHVSVGPRALLRADDSLTVGGVVDDRTTIAVDPTGALVLKNDVPVIVATPTPPAGSPLIQTTTLALTYTATSFAGVGSVTMKWSPVTPDRVDAYPAYPVSATPASAVQLSVPATATEGPATLVLSAIDRAGRSTQLAPISFTIVANAAPVIDKFDVVPASLSLYPGHGVTTTISAHDDLKITKLTLTSTIGTGTPNVQTTFPNTAVVTDQNFAVAIPIDTPGGQTLTLDAAADDGFPGRIATKQTKLVSILKDTNPPSVTITSPAADTLFLEGTGNTIPVSVTITDAEVGVKDAFVQIDNGAPVTLTHTSGNLYTATLPVPSVDGIDIVQKTLTVTARDYENNVPSPLPSVSIRIKPINDPNAPVVSWACPTPGAMYPAGYSVKLRVFAIGNNTGNPANGIQKVEMFVGDSTTPITATPVSGLTNYYEAPYAIASDAPAGSTIAVRVVATNASGLTDGANTSFAIVSGQTITADKTITATDTSFDNQTVIVQGGTTTILGQHTFDKLIVLDGAKVTHPATDATTVQRLNFTATSNIFVSCTGSIDVSQRGITGSANGTAYTYDRATDKPTLTGGASNFSAGSHGGQGGLWIGNVPAAYGSPIDPNTPGGAGSAGSGTTCSPCRSGGGVVRMKTSMLVVDGKILANGEASNSSAAGGSIRIDADAMSGAGEIHADGGANPGSASGGGGRIAIYYKTNSIPAAKITAASLQANTVNNVGAAGTIYLRQLDSAGAKLSDELVVDNTAIASTVSTVFVTAGGGTVSTVNGNVVTLSAPVPFDIEGTWIEFLDATGAVSSSYEITARTATTVTLRLGAGESAANVSAGAAYRGTIRTDRMTVRGLGIFESSAATAATFTGAASSLFRFTTVDAVAATTLQTATMEVNGTFTAPSLSLVGSTLSHTRASATNINRLAVNVAGAMNVDAASAIDVSTRGITGSSNGAAYTYDRATDRPTLTGGAFNFSAGSHGGQGGFWIGNVPAAYGSLFDPNTPGGAGSAGTGTVCTPCRSGGGVARIKAATLQLDGKILANGEAANSSGAGGSIRIDAGSIVGAGEIHADGGANPGAASGGGGRIAIYYNSLSIPQTSITAASLQANTQANVGAPGTIYLRQNDTAGSKVTDELIADNLGRATNVTTVVATTARGVVMAVNGNVVTLSTAVPFDIEGTWIEFLDATGSVISSYEIVARTAGSVTVRLNAGETSANAPIGSAYRGMLNVDRITSRGLAVLEGNGVIASTFTNAGGAVTRFGDLHATGDVTLQGASLEVNGSLSAANLTLLQSSLLTQSRATATSFNRLNVSLSGTLTIDATSAIDVSARGITGSSNGTAYTYDRVTDKPTLTGGAFNFSAGSHGGQGGFWIGNVPPAYGSVFDPNEPGGAGSAGTGTVCMPCRSGGGVVRIKAAAMQIDGRILANGEAANSAGAGGSIRLDATTIGGAGEIHADGGLNTGAASGGGGRIAIYYDTLSIPASRITAASLQANSSNNTGAPGTTYLKPSSSLYGNLVVDNLGLTTTRSTTLTSVGYSTVTDSGSDFVRDANAQFLAPDQLRGVRLMLNYDRTRTWPIVSNDTKILRLDVSSLPLTAQAGQPMRGIYKLDGLKLRNAKLDVMDILDLATPVDKDAASSIAGNNQAPPVLTGNLITLQTTPTGAAALAQAGAVSDLDTPITLFATNTANGNVFTAVANTDGSFAVPIQGNAGDAITIKARDANTYPLESPVLPLGSLASGTPVPSQVPRTSWTTDTAFLPRTLSRDGAFLAVASYPFNGTGSSANLVILSVADPAHPTLLRTVNPGAGAIRDVVVQNGWAYGGGDRFFTLNLSDPNATANLTGDPCGSDASVAVFGGYAFTTMADCFGDGEVNIYDVSTPSVPRYIRTQGFGFSSFAFTDILTLGNDYLVALSNNRPGNVGHDVTIIDRRDLSNLKKVVDIDIPNFDAFRGTIVGSTLYLVSLSTATFAVVDLSNPASPTVIGTGNIPAPAGGAAVIGSDAFAAAGASGLATLTVADPTAPALTGTTAVAGNAFDVTVIGPYVYVANELGIALVPALVAPQVILSHISMSLSGTTVTIAGTPQSVSGNTPITLELRNASTGATVSALPLQSDGSFTTTLPASPGDPITIKATDVFNRVTGPLTIGTTPFGSQTHTTLIPPSITDANFLARNVATAGNNLAVGSYPTSNGSSDKIVLYDITDRANPVYKRTVPTGAGALRDIAISNGYLIFGADRLGTLDLSSQTSTPIYTGDPCGSDLALEVVGGYAFTAMADCFGDGEINVYDVSTPSQPRYIRSQGFGYSGFNFTGLTALGSDYIVAVSNLRPGNVGHDVVVIDRRDVYNMKKVADIDIPNFDAFRVKAVGTTIYVAGVDGGLAVLDLSTPSAPVITGIVHTPGYPRSVDAIGAMLAVADGSSGATFVDISPVGLPTILGNQATSGTAWECAFNGATLYVVNEQGLAVIDSLATAPLIDRTLIINASANGGTMATVTGSAKAILGLAPVTIEVHNVTTGATISGLSVASDGSFQALITGSPGNALTIKATDTVGRVSGPLSIGTVPFGSQTHITTITPAMTDANFLARNVATAGNYLAVGSYPTGNGSSDKIVLFDVTDRANPVYKRTVTTGAGALRDMAIVNGYLVFGADRLGTLDLSSQTSAPIFTGDPCGSDLAVEVVGGYAFAAMADCFGDGEINVYDVSTPSQPRYLRSQGFGYSGFNFTGLAALGSDYLVGVSNLRPGNVGHDVVVIDRRDVYNMKKVADIDIPNFDAFRVKAVGTTIYLAGVDGGLAVVNVANPLNPQVVGIVHTPGYPRSVDAIGALLGVADGSAGATFVDISPAGLPVVLGNQSTGGTAWECAFNGTSLYIVNELTLAVIDNLGTPPLIDRSLITTSSDGATTATVTGSAKAISGLNPITIELRDTTTGASVSGISVAGDGSFTTTITAVSGDSLTLKATDSAGRASGPLGIGIVPFGAQVRNITISTAMSDANFLARNVAADGNDVVVTSYANSDKILVFDASTPGNPVYKRTVLSGAGVVRDVAIKDGYAIIAADRLASLNLADPAATPVIATGGDPCGNDLTLEVSAGHAFTTMVDCFGDGEINIWDVSTPSTPRFIRSQGFGYSGFNFTGLTALGSDYIVGTSNLRPGNIGHDVVVFDRRDIYNLKRIADYDIPNFDGFHAKAIGNTLYVAGVDGGVAIVDLSNPAAPALVTIVSSAGAARSIDAAGSTLAVANGSSGISFIDVTSPAAPRVIGSQPVPGSAWDVALSRGAMYVASELGLTSVANVATPPMLKESLVTVTPSSAATTVSGAAQALTGIAPITVQIANNTTSTSSSSTTVNADGSFVATITALPGNQLSVVATDAAGRTSTRRLGSTFGTTTTAIANQTAANDVSYRARRVASDGAVTILSTGSTFIGGMPVSGRLLLFRQSAPADPPTALSPADGGLYDVQLNSGYAYLAGDRLATVSLSDSVTHFANGDPCGNEGAIAISAGFAFSAMQNCFGDGEINIYDVSNPSAPRYVRSQGFGFSGLSFQGLTNLGTAYLIAFSPDRPGNVDHDVSIIDRTNVNSLVKVAELGIANFDAVGGAVDGATLYVAGADGSVAVVDVTNPFSPQLKSTVRNLGSVRGVAVSGTNEIVAADGRGLTFIDVTDKSNPIVINRQILAGDVVGVGVVGNSIYVAAESYFHMILRP